METPFRKQVLQLRGKGDSNTVCALAMDYGEDARVWVPETPELWNIKSIHTSARRK